MGSHWKGPREEVRALDAYIKLSRAAGTVAARVTAPLAGAGLTESQFGALETLYHLGPLPQRDLGAKLFWSAGNVTFVVDLLERAGHVSRERSASDRRVVVVSLTPAGRAFVRRLLPPHVRRVVEAFSALTVPEQEELARLCRKVGLASAAGPAARPVPPARR